MKKAVLLSAASSLLIFAAASCSKPPPGIPESQVASKMPRLIPLNELKRGDFIVIGQEKLFVLSSQHVFVDLKNNPYAPDGGGYEAYRVSGAFDTSDKTPKEREKLRNRTWHRIFNVAGRDLFESYEPSDLAREELEFFLRDTDRMNRITTLSPSDRLLSPPPHD